ncbi:hypothetical protein [Telluribacter sp. SYSU D00476]|uniref:hypothetical protein n=1 Tax=Telluribacter sp. SYSU D00476 TaxID=2811430 RepID=UPI001FF292BE|nr:hypothetical protein [Telluribacter sp. SYSU D00476]
MNEQNLKPFSSENQPKNRGRKPGSKNRSTIIREWLDVEQVTENPVTGEMQRLTVEEQITLSMVKKALLGDVNAYKALMDSAYGKPTQYIDTNQDITVHYIDDDGMVMDESMMAELAH